MENNTEIHTPENRTREAETAEEAEEAEKTKEAKGTADRRKGIFFILVAAFFFSLMSVFVRLSGDVPTMQKAFFRNIVAAAVAVLILIRKFPESTAAPGSGTGQSNVMPESTADPGARTCRRGVPLKKEALPPLLLRSIFGTIGILANFWAVDHLGIADANMLNKLSPFFAILMSIFILGEKPNRIEWLSVLLAFIGAAFVAKPSAGILSLPALVGILGGFTAGTAYTYVRKLGLQGVKGPIVVAFFSTFSTLVLLPNLLLLFRPMTMAQTVCLLLAGCSAAGGQLSITAAYQHAPAREISVFDYSQVVYAAVLGFLLFGEVPDVWSIIGYAIIIGTAFAKWYLLTGR